MRCRHFRQCIAKRGEPSLREAVALVRGPFVQGFGVPDAAIFDLVALEQQHALPSTAFAPSTAFRLPFVGRDALLAQLQDIAQAVAAGRGAMVLLQGTAGVGKSRLVDELLAALATGSYVDRHWTLLQGRCSPFDSILAVDDVPALQALMSLGRRHDELTLLTLPPLTVAALAGNPFVVAAIIVQLTSLMTLR